MIMFKIPADIARKHIKSIKVVSQNFVESATEGSVSQITAIPAKIDPPIDKTKINTAWRSIQVQLGKQKALNELRNTLDS